MFDMYLLIWQAATSDAARAPGMDQAMTAAVIFLLVKELLDWIGKFMPGLAGRGGATVGGQSPEYWQEVIANRTTQAVRAEVAPLFSRLNTIVNEVGVLRQRMTESKLPDQIEEIAKGVAGLVRSDDDRRLKQARTRANDA